MRFSHLFRCLSRCDRTDIHVVPQVKAVHTEKPTFFIYDSYPGGIGLSEKIFDRWDYLFRTSGMIMY